MTSFTFILLCLIPLFHIIYTDFTTRKIHLITWAVFLAISGIYIYLHGAFEYYFWDYVLNAVFLMFLLGFSTILVYKFRGVPPKEAIGLGDLLFFIPCVLWFDTVTFVLWFNITMVATLILHYMLLRFSHYKKLRTVPLAGFYAISLSFYLSMQLFDVL